jgi:hypothetical protein
MARWNGFRVALSGKVEPVRSKTFHLALVFLSICWYYYRQMADAPSITPPSGLEASRLRRRARRLLAHFHLPDDALPGSLALSHRRCGKPTCHCADGDGHPLWTLTFMAGGNKRVETIPAGWVETIRPRVQAGRHFKQAAAELLLINAELLVLTRKQRPGTPRRSASPPP